MGAICAVEIIPENIFFLFGIPRRISEFFGTNAVSFSGPNSGSNGRFIVCCITVPEIPNRIGIQKIDGYLWNLRVKRALARLYRECGKRRKR